MHVRFKLRFMHNQNSGKGLFTNSDVFSSITETASDVGEGVSCLGPQPVFGLHVGSPILQSA